MKLLSRILIFFFFFIGCQQTADKQISLPTAGAQILAPIKWSTVVEQTKAGEATLVITAHIDKGWHLYSQNIGDNGPIPTMFKFTSAKYFSVTGKTSEGESEEVYDPNFDMKLRYFSHEAVFKQKIKIKCKNDFTLKGIVEFMVCDDKQCLPPDEAELAFNVKGNPSGDDCPAEKSQKSN